MPFQAARQRGFVSGSGDTLVHQKVLIIALILAIFFL
jgi:hypothetical protein